MISSAQARKILKVTDPDESFIYGVMTGSGYETKCWMRDFVAFQQRFKPDWAREYRIWLKYDKKIWVVYDEKEVKSYFKNYIRVKIPEQESEKVDWFHAIKSIELVPKKCLLTDLSHKRYADDIPYSRKKHSCECGSVIYKKSLTRHLNSQKHKLYLINLNK